MTPKDLTPEQIEQLKAWATDGLQLGDIQNKIEEEFKTRLTFMDTRFLIDDLGIELVDDEEEVEEIEPENTSESDSPAPAEATAEEPVAAAPEQSTPSTEAANPFAKKEAEVAPEAEGDVAVSIDQINVPGTMLSGKVTFPDGKNSGWYIDQAGSLGLDPEEPGYRPSEAHLLAFQRKLQTMLSEQGM